MSLSDKKPSESEELTTTIIAEECQLNCASVAWDRKLTTSGFLWWDNHEPCMVNVLTLSGFVECYLMIQRVACSTSQ